MPGHVLYTEKPDGTDRVFLNSLTEITGLRYSHGLPGGPLAASWNFWADPGFDHRALLPGRTLGIFGGGGGRAWLGTLNAPKRGWPWQCEADGLGALANHYRAGPIAGNFYNLTDVIGQAVNRGLPWTLPASLPTGVGVGAGTTGFPIMSIAEVLNAVTLQLAETWWVDNNGLLTLGSPLTTPNYLFFPSDAGGGRSLNTDYVSAYYVFYTDSTTHTEKALLRANADRQARFGVVEQPLDLTGQGEMSAAQATAAADAQLSMHGPRVPYAGQFTLTHGQALSTGGVPVDLGSIFPPVTGQVIGADPDRVAELYQSSPTYVWVAQTDYDDDLDTLAVTPWDTTGGGLRATLAQRAA